MKKNLYMFISIGIFFLCSLSLFSQPPSPDIFVQGIFVDLVTDDLQTEANIQPLIQKLRNSYFNAIFPMVRTNGKVMFQSSIEPLAIRTTTTFTDPLLKLIEFQTPADLNEAPIYIIPWINIFEGYPVDFKKPPFPEHVLARHSEWIMLNKDGKSATNEKVIMIDPFIPEAQEYLIKLLSDLTQTYFKIQGIYIGDFSMPENGSEWGYNPITVAMYNKEKNKEGKPEPTDPEWTNWRRDKLTEFLKRINNTLKAIRPDVMIIVSVQAEGDAPANLEDFKKSVIYNDRMQDVPAWVEQKLIDAIILKDFFSGTNNQPKFESWLKYMDSIKKEAGLIVAVDGRRNFPNMVIEQLRIVRAAKARGSIIYQYREPVRGNTTQLFASLKQTVFKEKFMNLPSSGIEYDLPVATPKNVDDKSTKTLFSAPTPIPVTPSPTPTPTPMPEIETPTPMPPTEEKNPSQDTMTFQNAKPTPIVTPVEKPVEPAPTQQAMKWDKIYLKNGSIFDGRLLEEVEGIAVIENKDGFQVRIKVDDIDKIVQIID